MGKKRQKVNWVTVDGLQWTGSEEADTPQSPEPQLQVKGGKERAAGPRKTSGQGWNSNLAPRFEKKVLPASASLSSPEADDSQPQHIYYDGELCEAETLPNGFTKIRSKNLDILFKREYYEQRMATQKQLSEELNKAGTEKTSPETGSNDDEIISEKDMDPVDPVEPDLTPTLDKIDPDEIREFKPMNHVVLDTQTPGMTPVGEMEPGHPSGYSQMSSNEELPQEAFINQRPNLYLYSPSNNTLIPCEEIIIPNPVVSPETGEPVYTGPTNIYLAYPVQGPDGRSYITQPFPIHSDTAGPPGYTPGYNGYSPSVSYDGSNYYSSTPHTPNSGEDSGSGSSTQPTSPPPLVNYHPSNWFKEQHGGSDYSYLEYSYPTKPSASPQSAVASSVPTGGSGVSPEKINQRENSSQSSSQSSRLNNSSSTSPVLTGGGAGDPALTTVTYIPGLPQDQITQSSKSQKKRKKKSKPKQEKSNWAESIKSSSLLFDLEIPPTKAEESQSDESSEQCEGKPIEKNQNVLEVQLTDDLADSLVNPPTDTEVIEEEKVQTADPPSEDTQIETNAEETSETTKTLEAVKNVKNEVKVNLNSEDREICEITDQISTTNIENPTNLANDFVEEDFKPDTKNITESDDNLNRNIQSADPEMNRKGARNEKKSKQKKQKRGLKQVHNSEDGQNKCSITESEANSGGSSCQLFKKSYSSVIKSNLHSSPPPVSAPPTQTIEPSSDNIPPEKPQTLPVKSKTRNKTMKREEKRPIVRSDSWENIPACVVEQEENWEKTSKKRKQRNKSQVQTQSEQKSEEKSEEKSEKLMGQEEEVGEMEVKQPVIESKQKRQKTPDTETLREETEHIESPAREDEGDSEKKKMKKKKKKHESGEQEEASSVHKVLICDEQLLQQYTREIRKAKEVLCPSLVEKVSAAGYCDVVYVSELGSGIHRGAMGFGRLYQGKYVPPDRSDVVGDMTEDEEKLEEMNEKSGEDKDQEELGDANETEPSCNQSVTEADIDLD